jgi:hypothetical protein
LGRTKKRAKNLTKNEGRKEERVEERKTIHSSSPRNLHEKVENPQRRGGKS